MVLPSLAIVGLLVGLWVFARVCTDTETANIVLFGVLLIGAAGAVGGWILGLLLQQNVVMK